ncbi:dUTP diphosphatase [Leuconostocaceae bacterium ESL0958]|nr:dUTP diphosphatase [Leuconostocaceae bacterium ESL0958]
MRLRGFEIVEKYRDEDLQLPARSTAAAAGYDFRAATEVTVPPLQTAAGQQPTLVPTGMKAYMQEQEYLQLVARSSTPKKKKLVMPNAVGIVDADYYNNAGNEGEIFFQFLNFSEAPVTIAKGERIGQAIFLPYLLADGDAADSKTERAGGFGSTGQS